MTSPIAVIGGGLAGLTCALRLAERGREVHLYEAAPALGGRTRSHFDKVVNAWVDNGPHLMIGAYEATRKLLADLGAAENVSWQPSLHLPLFEQQRGHFSLQPAPWLPFPLALLFSIAQMPGHGLQSLQGMLRIAGAMKKPPEGHVAEWLGQLGVPEALIRDMLEPLCLGTMNEAMADADAASFAAVLQRAFASHRSARLGWFNKPLSEALIAPLQARLQQLGVTIHTGTTVRAIHSHEEHCSLQLASGETEPYGHAVIALPAHARNRLLGIADRAETSPITNVHLWFSEPVALPEPLVGSIGSYSQWFFDVTAQTGERADGLFHICAVISAEAPKDRGDVLRTVLDELGGLLGRALPDPHHHKIICERHATVVTRSSHQRFDDGTILDASEAPRSGELPATIEVAVLRGEEAANALYFQQKGQVIH